MELFAKPLDKPEWSGTLYKFNNFPAAVTTILVVLSGENWNEALARAASSILRAPGHAKPACRLWSVQ